MFFTLPKTNFNFSVRDKTSPLHKDHLINPFPNKPWFLHVCSTSLLKTLEKAEIACNEQFLLSPAFSASFENFLPFPSNLNCRLQALSTWRNLKFVAWKRAELGNAWKKMFFSENRS